MSEPSSRGPVPHLVIVGGGAAGFFAGIAAAETNPRARVTILERTPRILGKVRISGGGRCNVTHRPMEPDDLVQRYPRGGRTLLGPFHHFGPHETIAWFEKRGVRLKTEADGRMFPTTDSSATIIDCLSNAAERAGVVVQTRCALEEVTVVRRADEPPQAMPLNTSSPSSRFLLRLQSGDVLEADRLLFAMGGLRAPGATEFITGLGHHVQSPVPSLFSLHCKDPRLRGLAGVSVDPAWASLPGIKLSETGPVLITHEGLSGPAILRLSAWGARDLHARAYRATVHINWLSARDEESLKTLIATFRHREGARRIAAASPFKAIPRRLWERLVAASDIAEGMTWARLGKEPLRRLREELLDGRYEVTGKSLNKDEFVTCGGVCLREVDFRTMESKLVPGLHFAGEVLDIDGITGGFNFQAAWTTGWLAGRAMGGAQG